MLQFRSELDDADVPAASPLRESAFLLPWCPAVVRWVLPTAAGFFVGTLSVWWGLHALAPAVAPSAPAVEVRGEMSANPPSLTVVAGMPRSAIQLLPNTRIALPPVAHLIAAVARPRQVLAPGATLVPTPNTPAPPSAERRVDPPPLTALATLAVRSGDATVMPPAGEVPRLPVAPAPAVAPAVAPTLAGADASADEYAVRRTLHSYEEASEELDVAAMAKVWPTVDRAALTRAFATLKSQGLDFRSCSIAVDDSHAVANCRGTVHFVRKVGNSIPLTSEQQWVFQMHRVGADWKIDQVSASPVPAVVAQRVRGQG